MAGKKDEQGAARLTVLMLSLAGLYLGFRAWTVLQVILAPPVVSAGPLGPGTVAHVTEAQARDVALAEVGETPRDPFSPVRRVRRPTTRQAPPEAPPPQLRMILYDQLSPEVQFSVNGELSGRLKPGQSFKGWTVVLVSARSCVVSKDGETLTLTPRR